MDAIKVLALEALQRGSPTYLLRTIQGRVIYAEGQAFGRLSAPFVNAVTARLKSSTAEAKEAVVWALKDLVGKLEVIKPRIIDVNARDPPVLVFTDGACEGDLITVGGVIFPSPSGRPKHFGLRVPLAVWQAWRTKAGQRQVIGQAEILPVVIVKLTFPDLLRGRRVIVFIDNEAARIGLVRCYSPSVPSLRLISQAISLDVVLGCQS